MYGSYNVDEQRAENDLERSGGVKSLTLKDTKLIDVSMPPAASKDVGLYMWGLRRSRWVDGSFANRTTRVYSLGYLFTTRSKSGTTNERCIKNSVEIYC
jgi:hypothetical protein